MVSLSSRINRECVASRKHPREQPCSDCQLTNEKNERENPSGVVTLNDALSCSWRETIIFSERRGIERDPSQRSRFIKRSRPRRVKERDPERVSSYSAKSEFVVVVVVVFFYGERTVFSARRRQNRSLPKVSPGGLACRNAM